MNGIDIYDIWQSIKEYINAKDREEACYTLIQQLVEKDEEYVKQFKDAATEEDDKVALKAVKEIEEQYGLETEEEIW